MTGSSDPAALPLIGLVEDTDHEAYAFQRVFSPVARIRRWKDGEALIEAILLDRELLTSLDVLILDLGLPGIDGVHVAHTVRTAPGGKELPIVVLSGSSAERDIVRALDAEVTEYEVKPNSVADFRLLMERTMALVPSR